MKKRERLEKTLAGEATDRVPVALWRYWPGDDQRTADFARSTIEFQQKYDWDFVKINPAATYAVTDYGLQTEWQGDPTGERQHIKHPIKRSLEWTELRPLDPRRGELGKHLDAVNMICEALPDVPIITTIYSPLTQASMLGENDIMIRNLRNHPDRLQTGLNVLTETVLNFIDVLKRTNISGIFYVMDCANYSLMSEDEYKKFGLPSDRRILDTLPTKWWFNMLGLHHQSPMFDFAATYPMPVISWDVTTQNPAMDEALSTYRGALCTGVSNLHFGTPASIRANIRDTINAIHGRRLILSAHQSFPVTTPLSNLRAVREIVENVRIL